jgi:integrase
VRLLLLTGQRLREVAEITWSEIDLDKALWTIPPERMKADAPHVVPLAPKAVELLESLPHWHGPYVFSNKDGARPIAGFSDMKARLDTLMPDISDWWFHDLRRTLRTGLSALRIPETVAELAIAHTQKGLHRTYDQHASLDEKRYRRLGKPRACDLRAGRDRYGFPKPQVSGRVRVTVSSNQH